MFTYTLSRSTADDDGGYTSTSITDRDPINAAHMLAAAFNTVNRPMLGGFVLGVVNAAAATVEYDGKREDIKRPDLYWSTERTITFNPTAGDADTILTLFGNGETPTFMASGKFSFAEESRYAHVSRDVLEAAYAELQDVKDVLAAAGVETIPAAVGVQALTGRLERERHARQDMEVQRANQNAAARDELIEFARGAYEKLNKVDPEGNREDLQNQYRGMLDMLANLLVATGEADRDERHAVARRLVEKAKD